MAQHWILWYPVLELLDSCVVVGFIFRTVHLHGKKNHQKEITHGRDHILCICLTKFDADVLESVNIVM